MERKMVPDEIQEKLGFFFQNGWEHLFNNGLEYQNRVLQDIILLGNQSKYAADHGFAGITTKEEFEAKVPISEYDDYEPYVKANMKVDNNELTSLPTEYYLLSTGMSNRGKLYSENRLGALSRQLSINIWNMCLMQKVPQMTAPDVKMLAVTNCAPLGEAENGKAIRRTSSQAAKGLWEEHPQTYVFPYEFLEAEMSNDDRDYLTALYTLKAGNFNMLFCNNSAYFCVLLDLIQQYPKKMIEDIRTGHMSAELKDSDRAFLETEFGAHPDRADELERILEEHGTLPVEKIWPDFVFAGVWLAGSVGRHAKELKSRLPKQVQYISESYGASEGMFNLPIEYDTGAGPLATYSCYFEFLPVHGEKQLVDMAHVSIGEYYELVITTYSGLYRYNLHDIIKVTGHTGDTVNIEFCCRTADQWHIGEQTVYGYELQDAVEETEEELGEILFYIQGLTDEKGLSIIVQPSRATFDASSFRGVLQKKLEQRGIPMDKLYVMKNEYSDFMFRSLMQFGRTIQTIKLPLVAKNVPAQELIAQIQEG